MKPLKLEWGTVDYGGEACWHALVPAFTHNGHRMWEILLQPRPGYCDRGRWSANVYDVPGGYDVLDHQEGFPRYYFDLDRAKAELEAWAAGRSEIRWAKRRAEAQP